MSLGIFCLFSTKKLFFSSFPLSLPPLFSSSSSSSSSPPSTELYQTAILLNDNEKKRRKKQWQYYSKEKKKEENTKGRISIIQSKHAEWKDVTQYNRIVQVQEIFLKTMKREWIRNTTGSEEILNHYTVHCSIPWVRSMEVKNTGTRSRYQKFK